MSSFGDDSTPPPITPELRARIKRERLALGLTQRALAQAAGLHRSVVSKIEAGEVLSSVHLPEILGALRSPALLPSQEQVGRSPTSDLSATQSIIHWRNAQKTESPREFVLVPMFNPQTLRQPPNGDDSPEFIQIPALLLPPLSPAQRSDLLLIRASHGQHVIAAKTAQARDGALSALLWRDDIVIARLSFTASGYRLERKHAIDEIDFATFQQQITLIGEVIAIFQIEI